MLNGRLLRSLLAVLVSLSHAGCRQDESARTPDFVLISIEPLCADHVHCYGYDRETTPSLDRLRAEALDRSERLDQLSVAVFYARTNIEGRNRKLGHLGDSPGRSPETQ